VVLPAYDVGCAVMQTGKPTSKATTSCRRTGSSLRTVSTQVQLRLFLKAAAPLYISECQSDVHALCIHTCAKVRLHYLAISMAELALA